MNVAKDISNILFGSAGDSFTARRRLPNPFCPLLHCTYVELMYILNVYTSLFKKIINFLLLDIYLSKHLLFHETVHMLILEI